MSIAIFTPLMSAIAAAAVGSEKVWGKLVQKVVDEAELEAHKAQGWLTDANEALLAADTAQTEVENAALQTQIDEATKKLDGRSKAAREAKAAEQSAP